jgi:tetratricopeptide (TPR) repeat protein
MNLERLFAHGPDVAISAQEIFTNRQHELAAFQEAVNEVERKIGLHPDLVVNVSLPRDNVICYYGMGGIGKTTLSRQLQHRFETTGASVQTCRIDFSQAAFLDPELTLLKLRAALGQIGGQWPAFDIAFALYWQRKHPGQSFDEFLDRTSSLQGVTRAVGLGEQIQAALDLVLGSVGLAGTLWRLGSLARERVLGQIRERRLLEDCVYFEPLLNEADPDKMRLFLPVLLAWDLRNYQRGRGTSVVVFLDTWEEVQRQPVGLEGLEDTLARLVFLCPNMLFVITGRSRLTWGDREREGTLKYAGPGRWPGLGGGAKTCRQHLLGALSPEDCDAYLRMRLVSEGGPAIPPLVRRRIVEGSAGLPLYLDLSADLFDQLRPQGDPDPSEFGRGLPSLVARVVRDLDPVQRDLLRAAVLVPNFDRNLLRAGVPGVRDYALTTFLQRHFVRSSRRSAFSYSIHETVRRSVRDRDDLMGDPWSRKEWAVAADRMLAELEARAGQSSRSEPPDRGELAEIYRAALELVGTAADPPLWLLAFAERVVDLGLSQVLLTAPSAPPQPGSAGAALTLACQGLGERHAGRLDVAAQQLGKAAAVQGLPDPLQEFIDFYRAELLVPQGAYGEAERGLQAIVRFPGTYRQRATRVLAFLLERRGRYQEACEWADTKTPDLRERRYAHELLGWVNYNNGRFRQAEEHFHASRAIAKENRSPLHELCAARHLAAALAWLRPEAAVSALDEAWALNEGVDDRIGLGQILAWRAVAFAGLRPSSELVPLVEESVARLRESGASAESVAPLSARVFLHAVAREQREAVAAREGLLRLLDETNTHPYWRSVSSAWLQRAFGLAADPNGDDVQWLDSRGRALERWCRPLMERQS